MEVEERERGVNTAPSSATHTHTHTHTHTQQAGVRGKAGPQWGTAAEKGGRETGEKIAPIPKAEQEIVSRGNSELAPGPYSPVT